MNTPDLTNKPEETKVPEPQVPAESTTCESAGGTALTGAAIAAGSLAALLSSCRKDTDFVYEVNEVPLYGSAAEKDKLKSNAQFVSILYTNLFQQAMSSNQVFQLNASLESIGDQELAREVLISNFFNDAGVHLPTTEEMNADIDGFINDTYTRFFVRLPTEAERSWVKNFIQNNPYMTPELVYFSFALSNEYLYY